LVNGEWSMVKDAGFPLLGSCFRLQVTRETAGIGNRQTWVLLYRLPVTSCQDLNFDHSI